MKLQSTIIWADLLEKVSGWAYSEGVKLCKVPYIHFSLEEHSQMCRVLNSLTGMCAHEVVNHVIVIFGTEVAFFMQWLSNKITAGFTKTIILLAEYEMIITNSLQRARLGTLRIAPLISVRFGALYVILP